MKLTRKTFLAVVGALTAVMLTTTTSYAVPSSRQATSCGPHSSTAATPTINNGSIYVPVYVSGCFGTPSTNSTVNVDISHPRRGELIIDLVAYDGTEHRLKNSNLLDWRPDVHTTYTVNLSSEQMNSPWFLKVTDTYSGATGIVNSWSLTL